MVAAIGPLPSPRRASCRPGREWSRSCLYLQCFAEDAWPIVQRCLAAPWPVIATGPCSCPPRTPAPAPPACAFSRFGPIGREQAHRDKKAGDVEMMRGIVIGAAGPCPPVRRWPSPGRDRRPALRAIAENGREIRNRPGRRASASHPAGRAVALPWKSRHAYSARRCFSCCGSRGSRSTSQISIGQGIARLGAAIDRPRAASAMCSHVQADSRWYRWKDFEAPPPAAPACLAGEAACRSRTARLLRWAR